MKRISKKSIQNLVQSISLPEHMRLFVELKSSGTSYICLCPFHEDKAPSLHVYIDHYHCYACQAHGDIVDYEGKRTGESFADVVESLAQRYQIYIEYEEGSRVESFVRSPVVENVFSRLISVCEKNLLPSSLSFLEKEGLVFATQEKKLRELILAFQEESLICETGDGQEVWLEELDLSNRVFLPFRDRDNIVEALVFSKVLRTDSKEKQEEKKVKTSKSLKKEKPYDDFLHWFEKDILVLKQRGLSLEASILRKGDPKKGFFLCYDPFTVLLLRKFGIEQAVWLTAVHELKRSERAVVVCFDQIMTQSVRNKLLFDLIWQETKFYLKRVPFSFKEFFQFISTFEKRKKKIEDYLLQSDYFIFEIIKKMFDEVPQELRLSYIQKHILPQLFRVRDPARRRLIIKEISENFFSSSPSLLSSLRDVVDESMQISEKKTESILLGSSQEEDKKSYFDLMDRVTLFYHKILLSERGRSAREYLIARGIDEATMTKWVLGFCPKEYGLSYREGLSLEEKTKLEDLGLMKPRKSGFGLYDTFYGRITIPIRNEHHRVVGLGGRVLKSEDSPKYLNSKENILFSKSHVLFNLSSSAFPMMSSGTVIVVEGYMDCITLAQNGFENTVAVLGTGLTKEHVSILQRWTKKVILCFDQDRAGKDATVRAFEHLASSPLTCLVAEFQEEGIKDPDDFFKKKGKEEFLSVLARAKPGFKIVTDYFLRDISDPMERLDRAKKDILPLIASYRDRSREREHLDYLCMRYLEGQDQHELMQGVKAKELPPPSLPLSQIYERTYPVLQARSSLEIKLLLYLLKAKFEDLEASSLLGSLEYILPQVSESMRAVMGEVLSLLVRYKDKTILEVTCERESTILEILKGFLKKELADLTCFGLEYLLRELHQTSQVVLLNVFHERNVGFLRFHEKQADLLKGLGLLSKSIYEIVLTYEIQYFDSKLKEASVRHFDEEVHEEFQGFQKMRSERLVLLSALKDGS